MSKDKISTDGGQGLSGAGLPAGAETGQNKKTTEPRRSTGDAGPQSIRNPQSAIRNEKSRGRVDIRRETGGRGGKTVTVIDGFVGIGLPEKEQLAKKIRGACGCGGTVKDGAIEIQGDQRDTIARILTEAGFRPVFAGG